MFGGYNSSPSSNTANTRELPLDKAYIIEDTSELLSQTDRQNTKNIRKLAEVAGNDLSNSSSNNGERVEDINNVQQEINSEGSNHSLTNRRVARRLEDVFERAAREGQERNAVNDNAVNDNAVNEDTSIAYAGVRNVRRRLEGEFQMAATDVQDRNEARLSFISRNNSPEHQRDNSVGITYNGRRLTPGRYTLGIRGLERRDSN